MIPERNALMEHVYPQLKNFCRQQYRLEFQANKWILSYLLNMATSALLINLTEH